MALSGSSAGQAARQRDGLLAEHRRHPPTQRQPDEVYPEGTPDPRTRLSSDDTLF